jgi:hypothetical protein
MMVQPALEFGDRNVKDIQYKQLVALAAESSGDIIKHPFPFYTAAFGASTIILALKVSEAFQRSAGHCAWANSWAVFPI